MAGDGPLGFACACGTVSGRIEPFARGGGMHVRCHCRDCRAAEIYLGQPDPRPDGVALYQTTPDRIIFDQGRDMLALMALGPKGIYRWYAACCRSPLFNTARTARFPFAGVHVSAIGATERLGPVRGEAFIPKPDGSTRNTGAGAFVYGLLSRSIVAWISGRWRQTPFFDLATGKPVVEPRMLTKEERAAASR